MKKETAPKVRVIASVTVSPSDVPFVRGYLHGILESLFRQLPIWAFEVSVEDKEGDK